MLESVFRANVERFYSVYHALPYPFQNLLTSARGLLLAKNRYSDGMGTYLSELRTREKWSSGEIEQFQLRTLQNLLQHARATVPYYKDYPVIDIKTLDDIRKLPVLPREVVRGNPRLFISGGGRDAAHIRVGTTGTTGASLAVSYTEAEARQNWAFHMRRWAWAGVEPRTPRVTFFGSRVIPPERRNPPFWTHNVIERQTLASIFHLSESNASHYICFLRGQSGKVLEGFPSVLAILADFILKTGQPIPMRVIFTDGEPLYPQMRDSIEQAFNTRVFDLYGNTELCGLIHECERGRLHVQPDYAYLEILDEQGHPVEAGEEGFLVWTGFINRTMPLIRYRIGDRGCWDLEQSCECKRAFASVIPTITRDSDLLHSPDGRIFSPRALNQALKGSKRLRFCQIVEEKPGHIVIRGVASDPMASDDLMTIRKNLQQILGKGVMVSAMLADTPIVRAGGKIPLIIQAKPTQSAVDPAQQEMNSTVSA
jgi:phenylacetate-CoA ligase